MVYMSVNLLLWQLLQETNSRESLKGQMSVHLEKEGSWLFYAKKLHINVFITQSIWSTFPEEKNKRPIMIISSSRISYEYG